MSKKRRRRSRKPRTIVGCLRRLAIVAGLVVVALGVGWWSFTRKLPDVAALKSAPPQTTAFIERDKEAGQRVLWTWVGWDSISPNLKQAVLVSEDINFFGHGGFETSEIEAAIRDAVRHRRFPRGASTITQQVAKNLWLSPEKSFDRKLVEAVLTLRLERELGKRRILEIYLNVAQMGPGLYGAEAASRYYFDIPADQLDPRQAALLAASLPRPSRWHPGAQSTAYEAKVQLILARMERAQWLRPLVE